MTEASNMMLSPPCGFYWLTAEDMHKAKQRTAHVLKGKKPLSVGSARKWWWEKSDAISDKTRNAAKSGQRFFVTARGRGGRLLHAVCK